MNDLSQRLRDQRTLWHAIESRIEDSNHPDAAKAREELAQIEAVLDCALINSGGRLLDLSDAWLGRCRKASGGAS